MPTRRDLLKTSAGITLAGLAPTAARSDLAKLEVQPRDATLDPESESRPMADDSTDLPGAAPILLALKWYMIGEGETTQAKFEWVKRLGYDGLEIDAPDGVDPAEALAASVATELPIEGVVDSVHWQQRLSDPDEAMRQAGLNGLLEAIEDADRVGADSCLLVPGVVREDATHDQVWERSMPLIQRALPTAARLGIRILIENVWNGFCYDPIQLRDYIDAINSPWVGVHFDVGNHRRWGAPEEAIRILGPRIVKLDVKAWGQAKGFDARIGEPGEDDTDWTAVRAALREIGFTGWAAAEVGGGDAAWLTDVLERMRTHVQGR